MISELNALGEPAAEDLNDFPPEQARSWFAVLRAILGGDRTVPEVASVRDEHVLDGAHAVPIRIYDTEESIMMPDRVVVYAHGGGWVVGDLESADFLARSAARRLRARVVSVDYRLAPEHAFPAAYDDCAAVLAELGKKHPDARIAAMGDSAGANLVGALAAASRQRDDIRVDAQLLFYPALDPSMASDSMSRMAEGYILTKADMAYYWSCYLSDPTHAADPRATPAALADLAGMPPTVLVTAGFDPLHDEGTAYARRLVEADVATTYLSFPTLVHGFVDMAGRVPAALDALNDALAALDLHFGTSTRKRQLGLTPTEGSIA
ncbi:alpha/beta hydrolase [Actinoallomurus iriomotensis]|uniref:Acetylhydrolase n=1 Tax=Actinoallomurus iriomotensis TaxID=478107 RepID=A0A9W6SEA5_9ACTN|nr:alpha/beta hydrolase [Actinoallomurus iriomotensis]GLY92008.1 acetylhydrolase [Actinoallomurus iriomotensis]